MSELDPKASSPDKHVDACLELMRLAFKVPSKNLTMTLEDVLANYKAMYKAVFTSAE